MRIRNVTRVAAAAAVAVATVAIIGLVHVGGAGANECAEDCVDEGQIAVVNVYDDGGTTDDDWGWWWMDTGGIPDSPVVDPVQDEPPTDLGWQPDPADENDAKEGRGLRQATDALQNQACNDLLSGSAGNAAELFAQYRADGRINMDPDHAATITHPDGSTTELEGLTDGTGPDARIGIYRDYYDDNRMRALVSGVDPPLTADEGRVLTLLHELGHTTNAYTHDSQAEVDGINYKIFITCIRPGS